MKVNTMVVAQSWRDIGAFRGGTIDARLIIRGRRPAARNVVSNEETWLSTVRTEMTGRSAISALVSRWPGSTSTSRSRRGPEALAIARHSSEPRIRRSVATTDAIPVSDPQYEPIVRSVVNIPIRSASSAQSTIACACLEGG